MSDSSLRLALVETATVHSVASNPRASGSLSFAGARNVLAADQRHDYEHMPSKLSPQALRNAVRTEMAKWKGEVMEHLAGVRKEMSALRAEPSRAQEDLSSLKLLCSGLQIRIRELELRAQTTSQQSADGPNSEDSARLLEDLLLAGTRQLETQRHLLEQSHQEAKQKLERIAEALKSRMRDIEGTN